MERLQDKEKKTVSFLKKNTKVNPNMSHFFTERHGNVGNFGVFSDVHIFSVFFLLYTSPISFCYKEYQYSSVIIILLICN